MPPDADEPHGYEGYRVVSKRRALVLLTIVAAVGAVLLWIALQWIDETSERASLLMSFSPQRAAEELASQLRAVGVVNGVVFGGAALYLGWYAWRGIQTASIPPVGAWVVEGRGVRTGPKARRLGFVLLAAAGCLLALTIGIGITAWTMAAYIEDEAAQDQRLEERALGEVSSPGCPRYHCGTTTRTTA